VERNGWLACQLHPLLGADRLSGGTRLSMALRVAVGWSAIGIVACQPGKRRRFVISQISVRTQGAQQWSVTVKGRREAEHVRRDLGSRGLACGPLERRGRGEQYVFEAAVDTGPGRARCLVPQEGGTRDAGTRGAGQRASSLMAAVD